MTGASIASSKPVKVIFCHHIDPVVSQSPTDQKQSPAVQLAPLFVPTAAVNLRLIPFPGAAIDPIVGDVLDLPRKPAVEIPCIDAAIMVDIRPVVDPLKNQSCWPCFFHPADHQLL